MALGLDGEVIKQIHRWIEQADDESSSFAHIQAPSARGNIVYIPERILSKRLHDNKNIVLVVSNTKRDCVAAQLNSRITAINQQAGEPVTSKLVTVTYNRLLFLLAGFRDMATWNGLAQQFCSPYTVTLMDVDLVFNANFVLAFNAAVIFTTTYMEKNPAVSMKLITMSSGPPDPSQSLHRNPLLFLRMW
ncbi:hypothetical protein FHETE_2997 [Fusarium heterosporum]|uniref:Uncharacterized protein n=1 Tax=Fusarium heterosporum TaxID=42747 RepID=A0A8H5WY04_FUSHE|nr:hypothetical protein FHETE_2997 [Fusarium heterosporum]